MINPPDEPGIIYESSDLLITLEFNMCEMLVLQWFYNPDGPYDPAGPDDARVETFIVKFSMQ